MAVWKLKGCHLTCKHYTRYKSTVKPPPSLDPTKEAQMGPPPGSILLCMDFISFKLGNSIQSDVIFGTSYGEITTYCSGKHFVLNEVAHEAAINVIRVTDQLSPNGVINILTGGEDGFVKLWDASCRLLQTIDMRKSQVLADLKNRRAFGV
jgi:WD40 repeat protein